MELVSELLTENTLLVKVGVLVDDKFEFIVAVVTGLIVVEARVLLCVVVLPCNQNGRVSNKSDELIG